MRYWSVAEPHKKGRGIITISAIIGSGNNTNIMLKVEFEPTIPVFARRLRTPQTERRLEYRTSSKLQRQH